MLSLRAVLRFSLAAAFLLSGAALIAQDSAAIQQKLESQYTLTKPTADQSDVVTAGSVLVLEKDDLLMSATTQTAAQNTYKNGKISQGIWKVAKMPGFGHLGTTVSTRSFVSGEKFWVTKIEVRDNEVTFTFLSDPINDVRYHSTLKFVSSATPSADQLLATVGEVLKVQPAGDNADAGGDAKQQAPPAAPAAPANAAQSAPAPMAPIAPPPPPADTPPPAPKTIALKQTKEQVAAMFGQPTKVVKLGAKEIDYYPDMKVTFVNNKVTDVQ